MADPQFHVSSDIDLLIGAGLFWDLLCVGQIKSQNHPTLQKTQLGWIVAGRLGNSAQSSSRLHSFHASITNVHDQLNRFWQLEGTVSQSDSYTIEENLCKQHFLDNVSQNSQGRYVVKLPVKEHLINKLGDSRDIALKGLKSLENRFTRDPELRDKYAKFIHEYIALGHMRLVDSPPDENSANFYLPHHFVFKKTNQGSKLRVVFDASCKSAIGISLNNTLLVGPVVQQDLTSILMRFRTF